MYIRYRLTRKLHSLLSPKDVGYEDVNDPERLSMDPVMRHVVGGRAVEAAASMSEFGVSRPTI